MNISDDSLESIRHEIRIVRAYLRAEEMRRERFVQEIGAVRLWQQTPGQSSLSRWIADVTLQRWQDELEAVNRSVSRLSDKLHELRARLPPGQSTD